MHAMPCRQTLPGTGTWPVTAAGMTGLCLKCSVPDRVPLPAARHCYRFLTNAANRSSIGAKKTALVCATDIAIEASRSVLQFIAMLLGSGASVFVSVGAYLLYTSSYEVPGPQFPAPTAEIWLDMAKLVSCWASISLSAGTDCRHSSSRNGFHIVYGRPGAPALL